MSNIVHLCLRSTVGRCLRSVTSGKGSSGRLRSRALCLSRTIVELETIRSQLRVQAEVSNLQVVTQIAGQTAVRRVRLFAVDGARDGQSPQIHHIIQRSALRKALGSPGVCLRLGP